MLRGVQNDPTKHHWDLGSALVFDIYCFQFSTSLLRPAYIAVLTLCFDVCSEGQGADGRDQVEVGAAEAERNQTHGSLRPVHSTHPREPSRGVWRSHGRGQCSSHSHRQIQVNTIPVPYQSLPRSAEIPHSILPMSTSSKL